MNRLKTVQIHLILIMSSVLIMMNNCSDVSFENIEPPSGEGIVISEGIPVDPEQLPSCNLGPNVQFEGACLIFHDDFERENIVNQEDFRWRQVIMDNGKGYEGGEENKNVDVEVHNDQHIGSTHDGTRAALFRGRQGGSTHEIYLVSRAFDLSSYDKVFVQFWYVPIDMEESISLSGGRRETIPEGVRIDLCEGTDIECGVDTHSNALAMGESFDWIFNEFSSLHESSNNIGDIEPDDWKLAQYVFDLSGLTQQRRAAFIFRLTAAMDEGYIGNNSSNSMEDGIIVDDLTFAAIREPQ